MKVDRVDFPTAKVVEVIVVEFRRGKGRDGDPIRIVTAYYNLDGTLLAENDPCDP